MTRAEFKRYYAPPKPEARDWAVIPYRADNMYRREEAVRIYKTEAAAEKAASKAFDLDNRSQLVVRDFTREVSPC